MKRAALSLSDIHFAVIRGNNPNDPVVGRVRGVVVDEGGHIVCLPSVT